MSGRRIVGWVVFAALTLLYALMVVNAVGNLTGMQQMAAALDAGLSASGWLWLLLGIALPLAAYAIGLLVARRGTTAQRLLALLAGIAVVSAFQLEIMHLVPQFSYFAI